MKFCKYFRIFLVFVVAILLCCSVSVQATILFEDNFDDGNYDGWDVAHGTWWVQNEQLYSIGAGPDIDGWIYAGDENWTDYVFETKVEFQMGNAEFIFRSTGHKQNEYRFSLWSESSPSYTNCYGFSKYKDGISNQYFGANRPTPVQITDTSYVKIVAIGNNLSFFVNDELVYHLEDTDPLLNGRIGLGVIWSWSNSFDDVLVTPEPATLLLLGLGGLALRRKR